MEAAATMADRYSLGELRVSHDQNLLLPWVRESDLAALWQAAKEHGFATPNIGTIDLMFSHLDNNQGAAGRPGGLRSFRDALGRLVEAGVAGAIGTRTCVKTLKLA